MVNLLVVFEGFDLLLELVLLPDLTAEFVSYAVFSLPELLDGYWLRKVFTARGFLITIRCLSPSTPSLGLQALLKTLPLWISVKLDPNVTLT